MQWSMIWVRATIVLPSPNHDDDPSFERLTIQGIVQVTKRFLLFSFLCDPAKSTGFIVLNWDNSQLFFEILSHTCESLLDDFTPSHRRLILLLSFNSIHAFFRYKTINSINLFWNFSESLLLHILPSWDCTHTNKNGSPCKSRGTRRR